MRRPREERARAGLNGVTWRAAARVEPPGSDFGFRMIQETNVGRPQIEVANSPCLPSFFISFLPSFLHSRTRGVVYDLAISLSEKQGTKGGHGGQPLCLPVALLSLSLVAAAAAAAALDCFLPVAIAMVAIFLSFFSRESRAVARLAAATRCVQPLSSKISLPLKCC